jgi:hypothetical protein
MVTVEEAVERARDWLTASGGVPANVEIRVHEFDLGYVLTPYVPPPPGPVPREPGGTCLVVDRETGELTTWPMLPPPHIAAMYIADRKARQRFPADVFADLRAAGWYPGRNVTSAVREWLERTDIERELPIFPAAMAALAEFGGLTVPQRGANGTPGGGYPSTFYPDDVRPTTEEVVEFGEIIRARVFPIGGNVDGPSHIVMDEHGRVFLLHPAAEFFIAESLDEALVWVTRGGDLRVVNENGTW